MKTFTLSFILFISLNFYAQFAMYTTTKFLDKNNVKAAINTCNNKFWNVFGNSNASYEVPKGKGVHAQFANSIWIGGLDNNGLLHVAANTYMQGGTDFWPGPLDTINFTLIDTSKSNFYNKLWKVDCNDINNFVTAYSNGSVTANTYTVPPDILNYPAKGVANFQRNLHPFFDANNDGLYNPKVNGDYPIIKGNQQVLSIFNDARPYHTETGSIPMGLEIHEKSYAYSDPMVHDTMQAINYTTFYHYTIYNRSSNNYHNVFISDWSDVDLGYYLNDYVGTDTINNFTYCYNAGTNDPAAFGVKGYGTRLPVISHALLSTNCSNDGIDNNNNGTIDEANEHFNMDRSTFYRNNVNPFPAAVRNPSHDTDYYNYMRGKWLDNSYFTFGGNAYGGVKPTKWVYPGDPQNLSGWTEVTASNTANDARIFTTSGPFNFPAHSKIEWGYAIVFSQDTNANTNTINQFHSRVQRDVRNAKLYDAQHQQSQCSPPITLGQKTNLNSDFNVQIYPNPSAGIFTIDLNKNVSNAHVKVFDITGRLLITKSINESYRTQIDLSNKEPGIYFVEITNDSFKHCEKIIKH